MEYQKIGASDWYVKIFEPTAIKHIQITIPNSKYFSFNLFAPFVRAVIIINANNENPIIPVSAIILK